MTLRDEFLTALDSLGRRKVRTALTSLGVVVGTVTLVVMVSLALGVRRQINRQFESIGLDRITVRPPGGRGANFDFAGTARRTKPISPEILARWSRLPGVAKVTAEVNLPIAVRIDVKWKDAVQPVRATGGDPMRMMPFAPRPAAVAGSLELPEKGGLVLSLGALKGLGVATNDLASLLDQPIEVILRAPRGESQSFPLHVHGISGENGSTVQISAADTIAMKGWWNNTPDLIQSDGYDVVTIRANDVGAASALVPQLKQEGFQVQTVEMVLAVANRIFTAITLMLGMICSIALLVASIGIANTMVMAIYERTREIGTLKAIGASRSEIRRMFMFEAGMIGWIGGAVGLGCGWALGLGLNQAIAWYFRYRDLPLRGDFFVVTLTLAVGVMVFATLIGVIAGILPAQRAASLDPLEALRHE